MNDVIGWGSSIVLLGTIVAQIGKQWSERTSRGVTPWLYVGQAVASLGFCVYSALLDNWVFIVTNVLLTLAAFVGLSITVLPASDHGHREQRQ